MAPRLEELFGVRGSGVVWQLDDSILESESERACDCLTTKTEPPFRTERTIIYIRLSENDITVQRRKTTQSFLPCCVSLRNYDLRAVPSVAVIPRPQSLANLKREIWKKKWAEARQ